MSDESTQIVLRQFLDGQIPAGSVLARVVSDLSAEDLARLRKKASEGMLALEIERMAASNRFHASSAEIRGLIESVRAIETGTKGTLTGYRVRGEYTTASGKTTIEVKKGCFVATAVYGSYNHPNVIILREVRDKFLNSFLVGRLFCSAYYFVAPRVLCIPILSRLIRVPMKFILDLACGLLKMKKSI